MAADCALLTKNLCEFYIFADKVVFFVGAGYGIRLCTLILNLLMPS